METVKEKFNFQPVFAMRLAGYLMLNGFVLMDTRENERYPGKKVFYFKNSENLQQTIEVYVKQKANDTV